MLSAIPFITATIFWLNRNRTVPYTVCRFRVGGRADYKFMPSSDAAIAAPPQPAATTDVSRPGCVRHHGYRHFLNQQQRRRHLPPLLWTFPGAGNTWIRGLLDFSTGVYSGSIYGDPSLLPLLPGEGRCDRSVVAIKAHPQHIDSFDFIPASSGHFRLNLTRKPQYAKCAPYRFSGAIAVVRDPYRAIWAEYKRHVNWREVVVGRSSGETARKSEACRFALRQQSVHSGALLRACFDRAHFSQFSVRLARQYRHAFFHYGRFQKMRNARLLQVSFEDLISPSKRAEVLSSMVEFVVGSSVAQSPLRRDEAALSCAFTLADSPHIHRQHKLSDQMISINDAYANRTLVCLMWSLFRRKGACARAHCAAQRCPPSSRSPLPKGPALWPRSTRSYARTPLVSRSVQGGIHAVWRRALRRANNKSDR